MFSRPLFHPLSIEPDEENSGISSESVASG